MIPFIRCPSSFSLSLSLSPPFFFRPRILIKGVEFLASYAMKNFETAALILEGLLPLCISSRESELVVGRVQNMAFSERAEQPHFLDV